MISLLAADVEYISFCIATFVSSTARLLCLATLRLSWHGLPLV